MTVRNKGTWFLAALASLGAVLVGDREVRAGTGIAQIKVNGGYNPVGPDPFYNYIFDVYLEPGSSLQPPSGNSLSQEDHFTIDGLPGIDPTSSYHFTPAPPYDNSFDFGWSNPTVTPFTILNPPPNTPSYGGDATWAYLGRDAIAATTSEIFLGEFSILTTYLYPAGVVPLPNGATIDYSFEVSGQTQSGNGTFIIHNLAVPEPSSVIMFLAGAVAVPLFLRHERRRRRHQSQAARAN
jgi:PEP-CTERM motif